MTDPGQSAGDRPTAPEGREPAPDSDDPLSASGASAPVAESLISVTVAPPVSGRVDVARLQSRLLAAIDELGHPVERLDVRLVDDAEMSDLHARHSGIEGTTDVLTFATSSPDGPVDADIACCVDEAARQAGSRDHDVDDEVLLYAVHGLLHCVGHDDHDPEAYRRMHETEDRILVAIGVGARFGDLEGDAA